MTPHTYLDHGVTILQARLKSPAGQPHAAIYTNIHPFITISREACAGATTLGEHLIPLLDKQQGAEGRSWMFLDKDLINHALTKHHLPEYLAQYLPEDRIPEIKGMIGELIGLHPPLYELEQRVSEAILQIAHLGCVIFAGRAAHLITRALPGGLHLRLVASMESRIKRMQELQHCTAAVAEQVLRNTDHARRRYVQTNFGQDINDLHTYDLVINTDHITPDTAAHLVIRTLQDRLASAA
jgi:cytidylate kinase